MREIDRKTIEEFGIASSVLMERAGMQVAKTADGLVKDIEDPKVVVVAGKGNNGGDGLVAARELARKGIFVSVHLLYGGHDHREDSASSLDMLIRSGIEPVVTDPKILAEDLLDADLILDGIFGTGFSGEPGEKESELIEIINDSCVEVLSIDIPSGVDSSTGMAAESSIKADVTVSFQCPKIGNLIGAGGVNSGSLRIADIGIPQGIMDTVPGAALMSEPGLLAEFPCPEGELHKFKNGRVLVVAGSLGLTGAAVMASSSAMRAGAGVVVLAVPKSLNDIFESKTLEVMTVGLPETADRTLSADAFDEISEMSENFDSIALGPGISKNPETCSLVIALIQAVEIPMVLDADGINAIAGKAGILRKRKAATVITPHMGELSRLTGISSDVIDIDRIKFVKESAEKMGVTIVLKGARSLICSSDGDCFINPTGNRGMATAGTGDVLTGTVASLLAKGLRPVDASALGAYLHGLSGDIAAKEVGQTGMIASDLIEMLPRAIRIYEEEKWQS